MDKVYYTKGYCPIPREKKDIIKYFKLKNSLLNKFLFFQRKNFYEYGNFIIFNLIFNVFFSFLFFHEKSHIFSINLIFICFEILIVSILQLFLLKEWYLLEKKFSGSISSYEEIGLAEGKIWKKPILNLIQDNLILIFRIRPILKKLRFQFLIYNLFTGGIFLFFLT